MFYYSFTFPGHFTARRLTRQDFGTLPPGRAVFPAGQDHPSARMHLSLDTMNMVDDSCLSPGNFHELVKGGVAAVGTRVHSIDVILGFAKDQSPFLNPGANTLPHKVGVERLGDPEKQDHSAHPYGHLPLRDSSEQPGFHGEFLKGVFWALSLSLRWIN